METLIVDVTSENIAEHPYTVCFINPKQETFHTKVDWYQKQFLDGLRIKLLYVKGEKKAVGFVEYIPGEFCWRPVNATGYMFIHCLWTNGKQYRNQGLGAMLLEAVDADSADKLGVAVMTSENAFMATRALFEKNGYRAVAESGKDQLLVKTFKDGPLPRIKDWQSRLENYQGLNILYSNQCPWVSRFIREVEPFLKEHGLKPTIIEIDTAEKAQQAPSLYGVFNLIYNGRLLADRYISTTRFVNIVKKEIQV